jgi:hypothetical protein
MRGGFAGALGGGGSIASDGVSRARNEVRVRIHGDQDTQARDYTPLVSFRPFQVKCLSLNQQSFIFPPFLLAT